MKDEFSEEIHKAGSDLAKLSVSYRDTGQLDAASIAASISSLMLTLMGLNDTLEEIRDAIKEGK